MYIIVLKNKALSVCGNVEFFFIRSPSTSQRRPISVLAASQLVPAPKRFNIPYASVDVDKERRSVGADVEDVEKVSVIVPSIKDTWRHWIG